MLTLTGPGGCGKSRLALALASARAGDHPGGAWWVELASASDADLAVRLVAAATSDGRAGGDPTIESIARGLRGRRALLVLDDCEHVGEACATLVAALLGRCPDLAVLATSRTPLGAPGEQLWRVPGLPRTPGGAGGPAPAVELFAQRARLVAPSFALTPAVAPAVERVCRLLDGMPLAIELAAAKVAMLDAAAIADRLEADIRFLRSGDRTAHARHRSLEATLEWSHRLLSPPEQALLHRLSVFAGTFSLEAAEAVGAGPGVPAGEVLDRLAALVDHSLVQVDERGGGRYRLLEVVRQYAAQRLAAGGEAEAAAGRHAAYFTALAERAGGAAALERDEDNLRAALRARLPGAPEAAGRLVGLLWPFWQQRGAYQEARRWVEQALAVADAMSPAVRADVLTGAGVLAFLQCDYPVAAERLEEALALAEALGDRRGAATALQRLGSIAREQGRYADARRLHEQSLAAWEALGDRVGIATSLDYIGFAAWLSGDLETAQRVGPRALDALRGAGRPHETASALINLGAAALYAGDPRGAAEPLERALALSREAGYREGVAWALNELALVARRRHHPAQAADMLRESLRVHRELGDRWRIASVLEEIAVALLARIDPRRAVHVIAAAERLRDELGAPVPPVERPDREWALAAARRRLGARAFATAWAHGGALDTEAAIDAALGAVDRLYGTGAAPVPAGDEPPLTERERGVLRLLAEGRTNREIGAALYISASTAGVHVSNILRKLGAGSRAEAATLAHRLDLLRPGDR